MGSNTQERHNPSLTDHLAKNITFDQKFINKR